MITLREVWLLLGMLAATFSVRYLLLALSGRLRFPPAVVEALRFVPVAVLSAICVPIMFAPQGTMWLSPDNEYLVAGVASIVIAAISRRLLLTIVLGMALFLALRFLVPV
ncbi:MAG: branched-chain amino acid transport [Gammaproteobacteria bacterium]|nr:MAG: branched-chain amino acid transport [Gammaproteobacteria bacterium]